MIRDDTTPGPTYLEPARMSMERPPSDEPLADATFFGSIGDQQCGGWKGGNGKGNEKRMGGIARALI